MRGHMDQHSDDDKGQKKMGNGSVDWKIAVMHYANHKHSPGLILGLRPANEKWRYLVTPFPIG